MFLVPMRSPRRVHHFASCPDEFRRSDFRISKREVREKKINNFFFSLSLILSLSPFLLPLSFVLFYFYFILFLSGTHMLPFLSLLDPF